MVTVEIRSADGSFKSYAVEDGRSKKRSSDDHSVRTDMVQAEEEAYLKREANERKARLDAREDRACYRSRLRRVKIAVYEDGRLLGWHSKYAMAHKTGQPSGRKPRERFTRDTVRYMSAADASVAAILGQTLTERRSRKAEHEADFDRMHEQTHALVEYLQELQSQAA